MNLVMTVLTMMHLVTVGMMNPDILITATKTDIMMKMVILQRSIHKNLDRKYNNEKPLNRGCAG